MHRMLRRLIGTAVATVLVAQGAMAQSAGRDLVDTALTVQKFNLFMSLARDADMTFELKGQGPFTVLIPTDEAFYARYTKAQLDALRANRPRLRAILMHHIISGRVDAVTAAKRGSLTPMSGPVIKTGIVDGRGMIGGARFTIVNVNTSNGVIHGIDKVLVP